MKGAPNRWGWAVVFGRALVDLLERAYPNSAEVALITTNPSNPSRVPDHTRQLLRHAGGAAEQSHRVRMWPWDDPSDSTIVRVRDVPTLKDAGAARRRAIARNELRDSLLVRHPERVRRTIVVIDDVFTGGNTLNEVARALRTAGADHVDGLIIGRKPWGRLAY